VAGIADIGQVGTVDEEGTNDVACFPIDDLCTDPGIDEALATKTFLVNSINAAALSTMT